VRPISSWFGLNGR